MVQWLILGVVFHVACLIYIDYLMRSIIVFSQPFWELEQKQKIKLQAIFLELLQINPQKIIKPPFEPRRQPLKSFKPPR